MKFFNKEVLAKLQCGNCDENLELEWQKECKQAWDAYEKIKYRLSKQIKYMFEHDTWHDGKILSMNFIRNEKEKYDFIIHIDAYKCKGMIVHKDVQKLFKQIEVMSEKDTTFGEYLYVEIYEDESKNLVHNFLMHDMCEINITCKRIIWKPEK